ncbi:MAG: dihydrolipoyl dehydrogenase family protein, partial [Halobacteriota archaeon]
AACTLLIDDIAVGFAGTCVNVACIPTKHLLYAAELVYKARNHHYRGVHSTASADFGQLINGTRQLIDTQRKGARALLETMRHVTFIDGKARFVSATELEVAGQIYTSDRFIIATGSSPFIPSIPGLETLTYLTNAEALRLRTLPVSLVIVGGGAVALEFAQLYSRLGTRVRLLQRGKHILRREEPELTNLLMKYLRVEGIDIHTDANVTDARPNGDQVIITAVVKGRKRTFSAEHVLVATGRRPNTDSLGLDKNGVEIGNEGEIVVNDEMKAAARIWAAGDVTGEPMLEPVAAKQGWIAATNALSTEGALKMDYRVIPHAIFTDPQLASVGVTEQQAKSQRLSYRCITVPLGEVAKTKVINDRRGALKMIIEKETHKIIGVHMLAPQASDLLHEGVMIVKCEMTVEEVVDTLHIFPTLSEVIKRGARSLL